MALVDTKRFLKIFQYFPIRGHSFLPCDRDFGLIKRQLKKHDRLYVPEEYVSLMKQSSKSEKFQVKKVETDDIKNFNDWWQKFYKKKTTSLETMGRGINRQNKQDFTISNFMQFEYDAAKPGTVVASPYIDGLVKHTFRLRKVSVDNISPHKAYKEKNPINIKKIGDIKNVQQYIPEEFKHFYDEILQWPTTTEVKSDE